MAVVGGGGYLYVKNSDTSETNDTEVSQTTQKTDGDKNNNKQVTVKDEKLEGEIVSSFPSGKIPLYDGTVVSSSSATGPQTGKPEWNVDITTSDAIETIDASIRSAFSSNGWAIATDIPQGNGYLLLARNDSYTVNVTYNNMFGPMRINYGVVPR